jgi:hypothetical protein
MDESVFPYSVWNQKLASLSSKYQSADPFPHIVLEDILNPSVISNAVKEFPDVASNQWINYTHFNEQKFGNTKRSTFPTAIGRIVDELNSESFVQFLSQLTGIKGLFADHSLEGGGMHQSKRGGFLNVHADFTVHPHHQDWRRAVNVLVYLNQDWKEEFGGHLQLWTKDMKSCAHKILPVLNRSVIFNTDADSFHGHPIPTTCPENMTRKSIALYYFVKEDGPILVRSTEYRARPEDGWRRVLIFLDKMLLRAYDWLKRRLGFNDKFVSKILKFLSRSK